jgi:hypothetical protein
MMKYLYNVPLKDSFSRYSGLHLRETIMAVHTLGDKYGCSAINEALSAIYPASPSHMQINQVVALIDSHYSSCFGDECGVGEALAKEALRHSYFMHEHGDEMVKKYPRLGRDVILVISKETHGDLSAWRLEKTRE